MTLSLELLTCMGTACTSLRSCRQQRQAAWQLSVFLAITAAAMATARVGACRQLSVFLAIGDYGSGYDHSTSGSLHSRASRKAQRNLLDVAAEAAVKAAERQARVAAGGAQPVQQRAVGAGSIYSSSLAAANSFAAADGTASAGDQGRSGAWHPPGPEPAAGGVYSHQHRAGGTHTSSRAITAAGSGSEGDLSTEPPAAAAGFRPPRHALQGCPPAAAQPRGLR